MSDEKQHLTKLDQDKLRAEAALQEKDYDKLFKLFSDAQTDVEMVLRVANMFADDAKHNTQSMATVAAIEALRAVALRAFDVVAGVAKKPEVAE